MDEKRKRACVCNWMTFLSLCGLCRGIHSWTCCLFQRYFRQTGQRQIRLHVRPGWQIRNRSTSFIGEHRLEALLLDVFRSELSQALVDLINLIHPSATRRCLCSAVRIHAMRDYDTCESLLGCLALIRCMSRMCPRQFRIILYRLSTNYRKLM